MNVLEHVATFINVLLACSAMAMNEQTISGKVFQVQSWVCQTQDGPMVVKAWRRECVSNGMHYWGHINYLQLPDEWKVALYTNRFGEFNGGQGVDLDEAYQSSCGS